MGSPASPTVWIEAGLNRLRPRRLSRSLILSLSPLRSSALLCVSLRETLSANLCVKLSSSPFHAAHPTDPVLPSESIRPAGHRAAAAAGPEFPHRPESPRGDRQGGGGRPWRRDP